MKLFEKVLEKLGIFSKEFEESLDSATQAEREIYKERWEEYKNQKTLAEKSPVDFFHKEFEESLEKTAHIKATEEILDKHLSDMEQIYTASKSALTEEAPKLTIEQGKKFDTGKLSYTLLPFPSITEVVHILEFGKQKYGRDNWKKVPHAKQRYLDACLRHIISYLEGESFDPESGRHPLAHAVCCLLFVLWFDLSENV